MDWDPASGREGLAGALRSTLRAGRLPQGSVLPSTRALALDLGVARGTVTRVYADLAAEGYLQTRQGAPTTVATAGTPASSPPPPGTRPSTPRWNLLPGRPDVSSFPRTLWTSATRRVLRDVPAGSFGYAHELGMPELRAALARYLARSRGVLADPDRIVVCGGHAHAIHLLATALRDSGTSEIAFEDPSLPHFREVAAAAGASVVGVPVDDDGVVVSELDSPVVVVTPAHQYPLGVTLAADRRATLTRWADSSGALVVEDDYDGEFRFDRQPVGAVQALAPERVVYAGTASKALAPALRLSWLVLPRSLVGPVRAALLATGWRTPGLEQLIFADLLNSGAYDRHVRRRRLAYRTRRDRLLAAVPDGLRPLGISAGLHLVLMLPDSGPTEDDVLTAAARRRLDLHALGSHRMRAGQHPQGIIVGYAAPAEHAFTPTVDALLATLADVGLGQASHFPGKVR
ncbi:GntR family transcriptional regulator / MocR family aminotransferase [Amycolatopsis marina]|uniref:GntR family transcriptional regulator / MocR family aminotransferase n=1 Tax=Amycolatopsis marina TaxID=490629 RepID=A0A1I0YTD1_9PSEU|nr:GntR family transcriptional regulator / MocR family aminotransferase [Amycolatopsis marina]